MSPAAATRGLGATASSSSLSSFSLSLSLPLTIHYASSSSSSSSSSATKLAIFAARLVRNTAADWSRAPEDDGGCGTESSFCSSTR
ncbi:hypothetical protein TSAR_016043 [Trichomalopsis sarcophagae]|uniref:Uncharacterized protein n=1 Tax=Trichomalopsis sarcophagae TaxID=543379 RepID=A0A232EM00_9HYME|nr:hypothetical protein TSAR_016043 [Trichomalopsis sarcophagae]